MAAVMPEPKQAAAQLQGKIDLATLRRPGERGPQVIDLLVQLSQPPGPLTSPEVRIRLLSSRQEIGGVTVSHRRRLLTPRVELFPGKCADRLQHAEAGLSARHLLLLHQALVDKGGDSL